MTDYPLQQRWKIAFPTELERREAARFANMTWAEFSRLVGTSEVAEQLGLSNSKSAVVAHYRTRRTFDAVMDDLRAKFPPET